MTSKLASIFTVMILILCAGPAQGKVDQEAGHARLCAALLASEELTTDGDLAATAADLTDDTRGRQTLLVLIRWPESDPRLAEVVVNTSGAAYLVPPTPDRDRGVFAVAAGARRAVLHEVRRLEAEFGRGRVGFRRLISAPADLKRSGTVSPFDGPGQLSLNQIIFERREHPNVVLFDAKTEEPFYPVAAATLGGFEDAEFAEQGLSLGRADNLVQWDAHPLRKDDPHHLIVVGHYALASYWAFQTLKHMVLQPSEMDRPPSNAALAQALRDCLGEACRVMTPQMLESMMAAKSVRLGLVPTAAAATDLWHFAEAELPSFADFSRQVGEVRPAVDHIVRFVLHVTHGPDLDRRRFLSQSGVMARVFDRLANAYAPDQTFAHGLKTLDGRKLLRGRDDLNAAERRILVAWARLKKALALQSAHGESRNRQ